MKAKQSGKLMIKYIKDPEGHLLTIMKNLVCLVEEEDGKQKIRLKNDGIYIESPGENFYGIDNT
jgi:hypothetical protein